MDEQLAEQILDELFPALEALETRTNAILQLLKEGGIASEQDLTPYLDQAANASSVRWLATRVRIMYLLSSAANQSDSCETKEPDQKGSATGGEQNSGGAKSRTRDHGKKKDDKDQTETASDRQEAEQSSPAEPEDSQETTDTEASGKRDTGAGEGLAI
jgi:hypothetical protein